MMYPIQYDQSSNDSVRSESHPQPEFSTDNMEMIAQGHDRDYAAISQSQNNYFGGEPLTLYASGGEPVTLYANNAGVVSQAFMNPHQEMSSNNETFTLPPARISKRLLKPKSLQPKVIQLQPRFIQKQMSYQTGNAQPKQINVFPGSVGETQSLKVLPQAQKFYPLNSKSDSSFQISLNLDEYGNPTVNLNGNQKKFIQHIHQAVLNFMRDNKIPAVSFCKHVLSNDQEDALSIFLTRSNWFHFTNEEKMMYWRLSEWIKEPVTKRMYDLIQKEKDLDRKTEMTNHFVESTTVKKQNTYKKVVTENSYDTHSVPPPESIENSSVDKDSPNIFQSDQEESSEPQEEFSVQSSVDGQALLAELQSKTVPGPPRTRTTQAERDAIRYWSTLHPNSSPEERKRLACSLGLSKMSVWRLIAYDRKMSQKKALKDETEANIINRYKQSDLEGDRANLENDREEPNENNENFSLQDEKLESDLHKQSETYSGTDNSRILGSEISNHGNNQVQSRFITINSEKVKAVIRNAMKSNPAGFDPKKSFKLVLKPSEGPSKYNKLALDSYFKNKPNPTESQVEHFVKCTKVPYNITKKYLLDRGSFREEDSSYVAAKNKEFQDKLNLVSGQKSSSSNDGTQQNDGYFHQEYPPPLQQFQTQEPGPPSQHFQPQTSHQNQFSNLHKDQVAWLENFYQTTPNPDMQTIMDFSKCIDVPFATVAEFMERMQSSIQNNSHPNYQEAETNNGSQYNEEFSNVDPDVLALVRKISKKTYSPVLEKELKSLFGNNKIFCTLDDIKSYAIANGTSYQVIYKKLNTQENIQLVSEQTCKRLVGAASNTDPDDYEKDGGPISGGSNYTSIKSEPVDYLENQVNNFSDETQGHEISNPYLSNTNYGAMVGNKTVDGQVTDAISTKERVESIYDGLSVTMVSKDIPNIKQEPETDDTGIPVNNWLTSTELLFEENDSKNMNVICKQEPQIFNQISGDVGIETIEIDIETSVGVKGKRKTNCLEKSPSKKYKNTFEDDIPYDDSGYTTNEDSLVEGSSFCTSDSLSNIIFENVGKVNMLNESLDLFNDSVKDMDLVNDMYQKIENEDAPMKAHVKVKIETSESSDEENMMKALICNEPCKQSFESSEPEDPNKFNDLRKLFYGPFENFQPQLQVLSIKPGFKSDVFEVELSDGTEFSNNFYFKTGASALKNNLMIKLKQLRYIGARICVESFEIIRQESSILGNPDPIEDQFFTDLRSTKIEPSDIFEISSPKTIVEYILLEENVRTFIESFGCNIDLFKFASAEEDVKKEILFSLCKSRKKLQSKLLKILSSFLSMSRQDIEQYVQSCQAKLGGSSVYVDHGYCNLAAVFL